MIKELIYDMESLLREMDVPIEEGYIITPKRIKEVINEINKLERKGV